MGNHPLTAAVLSALIPGAGQLYARKPLRAAAFFLPSLLALAATYKFTVDDPLRVATILVQPMLLSVLLVSNGLVLVWRLTACVDAFIVTESSSDRSWMSISLTLILLAVAIPHLVGWSYGSSAKSTIETVFAAPQPSRVEFVAHPIIPLVEEPPEALVPEVQLIRESSSGAYLVFTDGVGDPDAISSLGNILAPSTPFAPFVPLADRVDLDRITILLVGGDAGPGREGLRTDTMIVATFERSTGRVALFGFPRNLKLVPLPKKLRHSFEKLEERIIERDLTDADLDGYPDTWIDPDGDGVFEEPPFESCHCFPTMLNKVHKYTQDWTNTYPNTADPGLAALTDVISHMIDLPIDYYFMVKMEGFVKLIDAFGGVDVLVKEPYHVTVSSPEDGVSKASVSIEPGMNHLDGLESLAYVRWRRGSSDYHRMRRQRCLVRAATTQVSTVRLVGALPEMLGFLNESVITDIPVSFLPDLVELAGTIDLENVSTVGFVPPTYSAGRTPAKYPIPNDDRIRWKVRDVLENGTTAQSRSGASECE